MIISKISSTNQTNYSNIENTKKNSSGNFLIPKQFDSAGNKVSFGGVLEGLAATIFQEALEGAARKIFGIMKVKNAIYKADDLFDRFDVKPAIDLAIKMDAKFGSESRYSQLTSVLLAQAITKVGDLPDEHLVNRDLKQRVLDHCYLDGGLPFPAKHDYAFFSDLHKLAENLLANLDTRYFEDYKKFLISKTAETSVPDAYTPYGSGILRFKEIDKVLENIRDKNFKGKIKKCWEEAMIKYKKEQERDTYVPVYLCD